MSPFSDSTVSRSRRRPRIIILVLIVAVITLGWWFFGHHASPGAAGGPQAGPPGGGGMPALPVTVSQPLEKEVTEWNEYTGQFAAPEYVELRAQVSGYLTEIHFTDGQIVKKGDLLFVVDPRPYEIALGNAKGQLAQAQASVDLAKRQIARGSALRKEGFMSESDYDQRQQQVRSSAGAVDVAQAAVKSAELNLEFTHITAPLSGRISTHNVSIGNLISGGNVPSPTLLTTIVSLDPIWLVFDLSEADYLAYQRTVESGKLQSARDGQVPVFARLADETGWQHEGRLTFIDNQIDRSAGTIRARGTFANADLLITPGSFGRVRIPISEPHQAMLLPDSAIVTDQSTKIVMAVGEDGSVTPKQVLLGPMIDGLRVVRSGITADDKIIINGLMRARPGSKVTPQPGTIEPAKVQ